MGAECSPVIVDAVVAQCFIAITQHFEYLLSILEMSYGST